MTTDPSQDMWESQVDIPHQPDEDPRPDQEEVDEISQERFNILSRIHKTHLWCDLEMSGLNPQEHDVIEVGLCITDLAGNLIQSEAWILHQEQVGLVNWSQEVIEMHGNNGLLVECLTGGDNLAWVEAEMVEFVQSFYGNQVWNLPTDKKPVLSGDSVHWDHKFIEHHFPEFNKQISFETFDIATLKSLIQKYQPDAVNSIPTGLNTHRVKADIMDSLMEFRFYLEILNLDENLPEIPPKNPNSPVQ